MNTLSLFNQFVKTHPNNIAIDNGYEKISYLELNNLINKISINLDGSESLIGVLGYKLINTYASILSIHSIGAGYVPLNPSFPLERTIKMIKISKIKTVLIPQEDDIYTKKLQEKLPEINFLYINNLNQDKKTLKEKIKNDTNKTAYILFTSGSTGNPKGVPISKENLLSYMDFLIRTYPLVPSDRCSQAFELTFDLSVHDIFVTLSQGACLVPLSNTDIYFPAHFIHKNKISVWFSVPSLINVIDKMKHLSTKYLSSLRLSFFCGEALEYRLANKWLTAASNSRLINLYGPTEATIAITHFEVTEKGKENNIVPIGKVFDGNEFKITDNNNELMLSGKQLTKSYLNDPIKTKEAFIELDNKVFYKTGDKVKLINYQLNYISRLDGQVKVNGNRVELNEVEEVYRGLIKSHQIVVLKETDQSHNDYLVLFINSNEDIKLNLTKINEKAKESLPSYMIPLEISFQTIFPTNSNGKIDKKKLKETYRSKL